ncbi:MAG: VacB/RNase II family 3'-5' exoribonuclease [Myxococcales bacterium]|nr:VacB/RNase II family 3'-5' exoribonuclease [Myxococcales bacterium]
MTTHDSRRPRSDPRPRILEVLRKRKSRALHVSEIRGRLGLPREELGELIGELEALCAQGLLRSLPGGRYRHAGERAVRAAEAASASVSGGDSQPPASSQRKSRRPSRGLREGTLSLNPRGFGFVMTKGEKLDVFIPPAALGGALHGDRVAVRCKMGPRGLDGRVLEVLERARRFVGGQLRLTRAGAVLEPDDERLTMPLRVRGDLPKGAATGTGAIAQVVGYPEHPGGELEVEIVETFGAKELLRFEERRLLLEEGVVEDFAPEVVAEAEALPRAVLRRDKAAREDLRSLPLLTIDPADARDHDDAVFAERLEDGGYRVVVAIADVSHYVPAGSALDQEALERGCTIYLPTRAIPMLPEALSSNLASLVPQRDRLTLAVEVELSERGAVRRHRFIEGVMRSAARLSYEGVARALGLSETAPAQAATRGHEPMLKVLLEVSERLRAKRRRRGAMEFELPEARVRIDADSAEPSDIVRSRRDPGVARAYGLIEELMILANEVVASDLSRRGLPAIFRVHGTPDADRIASFCELARALGFDISNEAAEDPKQLSKLLRKLEGGPHAGTMGYLLLRAMQQAVYQTDDIGHFGLASKHYLHFTSPIRRYPDLAVHRIVRQLARGARVDERGLLERLAAQAAQSSTRERKAMGLERNVVNLYGAYLMRERIGETFPALISGLSDFALFATLDAPFVDVQVRAVSLPGDRYELDRYGVRLVGRHSGHSYALGDRLTVRIEEVSIVQRKILATVVGLPTVEAGGTLEPLGEPRGRRRGRAPAGQGDKRNKGGARKERGGSRRTRRRTKRGT